MNLKTLFNEIALGEDSTRQFKADIRNSDSLAAEIVAFANALGGRIFIGVNDDGSVPGLDRVSLQRINQLISNTASQWVRSPVVVTTQNIALEDGRLVIVLQMSEQIHADALPTQADIKKLYKLRFLFPLLPKVYCPIMD